MNCNDIIQMIEKRYPKEYACEWDNIGLLVGNREKDVKSIFIALDATDEVVEAAVKKGADMLITHHPLIFGSIKRVTADDFVGRRIITLLQHNISYYAMHTNYDTMGMAELSAARMELSEYEVLEEVFEGEGIGRVGMLPKEMTLEECCHMVKEKFHLPNVKVFGELSSRVRCAAISPGAGKSMAGAALEAGADVLITGDIDHHTGIDMVDEGLAIIDAGHYGIEHIYIEDMKNFAEKNCAGVVIHTADILQPFKIL